MKDLTKTILEKIEKHNEDVMSFPTPRELLNANKRLEHFLTTAINQAYEAGREEEVENCKQKMAQSNEWWNKKLLSLTTKEDKNEI